MDEVFQATEQIRDCIDYRGEEDSKKYWDSYYMMHEENDHKEIIPHLTKIFGDLGLKGETCVDYGCGRGDYIPFLNHYYKNIQAVDFVKRDVPKLNGVEFALLGEDKLKNNIDLLFICDTLTWTKPITKYPDYYSFKDVIVIEKTNQSKNRKQKPIDLKELNKSLGVTLEEKEKIKLTNNEEYMVLHGKVQTEG